MRFCTNCGAELSETSKFCTECGQKLDAPTAAPEAAVVYESAPAPAPEPVPEPIPEPIPEPVPEPVFEDAPAAKAEPSKKRLGKKAIIIGAVAAVVIIAVILGLLLGGGGGAGEIYNALSAETMGIEVDVEGDYIELKEKGKAEIRLLGEVYSGKWESAGGAFTLHQGGDSFSGTLSGNILTIDYDGLVYTYEKEGAAPPEKPDDGEKPTEPIEPSAPSEPGEPLTSPDAGPYTWWRDQWYGWWIVDEATGSYAEWEGNYWDAYALIDEYGDGSGMLKLWDVDYTYDSPMAAIDLSFAPGAGDKGSIRAEGGHFMDAEIAPGDFETDPDANGFDIEEMVFIEYLYVSPENAEDTFTAYIFLRPWGQEWEDVEEGSRENWPYDDMMPMYYYEWYLPLIERDYPLPDSYQQGADILTGAANVGSGEVLASAQWESCLIEIVGAEHFVDWEGKDAIRVYYDFTNTSDDVSFAADIIATNVSQDDYEIYNTNASWMNAVTEEYNAYLSLRPGVKIRCVAEYPLKLSGGNIVFEFCNYWNEKEVLTVEFDPNALPGRPPLWEEEFIGSPVWTEGLPEAGNVGDYYVSLDHVEIVEGYELDEVFKVVLNFTNNSDEAISFSWGPSYIAFQNGIELNSSSPSDEAETQADTMLYEDIQPGASAQVAVCYALRNEQSPVEFEVYDPWTGDKIGCVYELTWGG